VAPSQRKMDDENQRNDHTSDTDEGDPPFVHGEVQDSGCNERDFGAGQQHRELLHVTRL